MNVVLPKIDDFIVDEIKDALRAAPDNASVTATMDHFTPNIAALYRSRDAHHRVMHKHILNLASYRRDCIAKGWG